MRKVLLRCGVPALLIAIICILTFRTSDPEPDVLRHAVKVHSAPDSLSYDWLSDHELLVHTDRPSVAVELIDTRSNVHRSLKGLAMAINYQQSLHSGPQLEFCRSPDGQWLVWTRQAPFGSRPYLVSARLDGSGYHDWMTPDSYFCKWVGKCQWLCEQASYNQPTHYAVCNAGQPGAEHLSDMNTTADRALLASPAFPGGSAPTLTYREVAVGTFPPSWNSSAIQRLREDLYVPARCHKYWCGANPQFTRIALLYSDPQLPSYARWLHRLLTWYRADAEPVERLFVYNTGTRALHEIGQTADMSSASTNTPMVPELENLGWMPNGKELEFFYHGAVYTLTAE